SIPRLHQRTGERGSAGRVADGEVRRSKLQEPGSRKDPSTRHQPTSLLRHFGFWHWYLLWMLALGVQRLYSQAAFDALEQGRPERTAIALEALGRLKGIDLEANPAVKAAVFKLLDQVRDRPEFVQVVRDFHLKGQEAGLLQFAGQHPQDPAAVDAVRLVLGQPTREILKTALETTNAVGLIEAMARSGDKGILPWLMPVVTNASISLPLRKQAVVGLARVHEGAVELLEMAKQGKLPDDLKLTASSELNQLRWPELKEQAERLLPLPQPAGSEPLPPISELVKMKGDATRGAEIFHREAVGCL